MLQLFLDLRVRERRIVQKVLHIVQILQGFQEAGMERLLR